ncbi:MAG: FAD:protein FMN transferase [Verrucomicrobiaceae bacterium]|nr:FAD:protein FMN transferase [Verrucomicrobiaceae bacterium]
MSRTPRHGGTELQGWSRVQFNALGSACSLIFQAPSDKQASAYKSQMLTWVEDFEERYSRYRSSSLISAINRTAGGDWVEIDDELESIFALCDHYHWSTGGVFDPTSLPLLRAWDYQAERPRIPSDSEIEQALKLVGWTKLERRRGCVRLPTKGMAVDLGGIGKEYAVDRVIEQAAGFGIQDILVDFGRDVRGLGHSPNGGPWRIGLENPTVPGQCWGGVMICGSGVATSGDYLRGFHSGGSYYSHILDPRTGRPIQNGSQSATVIAPSCTEAGVLATATLILGATEGLELIQRSPMAQGALWQKGELHTTNRFSSSII